MKIHLILSVVSHLDVTPTFSITEVFNLFKAGYPFWLIPLLAGTTSRHCFPVFKYTRFSMLLALSAAGHQHPLPTQHAAVVLNV